MKKILCLIMIVCFALVTNASLAETTAIVPKLPGGDIAHPEIWPSRLSGATFTIREGWNLIAIPVLSKLTIKDFIKIAEGSSVLMGAPAFSEPGPDSSSNTEEPKLPMFNWWKIRTVAVFEKGRFRYYPKKAVDHQMVPGRAYFVYAQYRGPRPAEEGFITPWSPAKTFRIPGEISTEPVALILDRGWNSCSILPGRDLNSSAIMAAYTLAQLSKELEAQKVRAKEICFWSASRQEWEQIALPFNGTMGPGSGFIGYDPVSPPLMDRIIPFTEGFFLRTENGLYIPGLEIMKVPFPKRYTGVVLPIAIRAFGPPPPYTHALKQLEIMNYDPSRENIFLKGANSDIHEKLDEMMYNEGLCRVKGKIVSMINKNGGPDDWPGVLVDVLVVESVVRFDLMTDRD